MMELTPIADHVAAAKKRLLEQYKGKPKVEGLIEAIVKPLQSAETALFQLLNERHLNAAAGFQLDRLGGIVGIARRGLDDESYRLRIRARILVNISEGDPETLIQIYKLLTLATLVIFDEFPVAVSLLSDGLLTNEDDILTVYDLMEAAAMGGVRVEGMGFFDPTNPFALDGTVLPYGEGLGSNADANTGGFLAGLYVVGKEFGLDGNDPNALGLSSFRDPLVGGRLVGL